MSQPKVVIQCAGLAGEVISPQPGAPDPSGAYLKSFDVDAFDGAGTCEWGTMQEAMQFDNFHTAFDTWRTLSKVRPVRKDGRPNRPLTAFHIQIVNWEATVDDAQH